MCKLCTTGNVTIATLIVSVLTLTLLSLERHNVLLKPMSHAIRLRKENVHFGIAATWLIALLTISPFIVLDGYDISKKRCTYRWKGRYREKYFTFVLVTFVFIPVVVIFCSYFRIVRGIWNNTICKNRAALTQKDIKQKQKIVRLLLIVTCVFIICFLPYSILVIVVSSDNNFTSNIGIRIAWNASLFLLYCSSSANPLIYHFQSSSYRDALRKIFHRHQKITTTRLQIHCEKTTKRHCEVVLEILQ